MAKLGAERLQFNAKVALGCTPASQEKTQELSKYEDLPNGGCVSYAFTMDLDTNPGRLPCFFGVV